MKIYTTAADGDRRLQYTKYDVGCMIPSPCRSKLSELRKTCDYFALDNGAFGSYLRGLPFMPNIYERTLEQVYISGIRLEFLVCPDIVNGGKRSLDFSLKWATGRLLGTPNLALALQDGMTETNVGRALDQAQFTWLFIGGGVPREENVIRKWVDFARKEQMKVHIGKVGTIEELRLATRCKVDSVDSSSFMRNQAWNILERFRGNTQPDLLEDLDTETAQE